MNRKFEVVIANCHKTVDPYRIRMPEKMIWATTGEHYREDFLDEEEAKKKAVPEKGKCVILRPRFNEEDEKGRFFREWRSFDGEPLKEVRWEIP